MKTLKQFLEQETTPDPKVKQAEKKENMLKKRVLSAKLRAVRGGATGIMASHEPEGEVIEGVLTMVGKKRPAKKAEKAMDAGARAKRKLARKVHAKYVSGSEDNVPDDIREAKVDTGTPEEKEKARNVRKFGVSHNVSGHGKLRRALHRSNRGDKKRRGDKSAYVEMESVVNESEKVAQGAQKRATELGAKRRQASYKKYGANVGSPGKNERAGYNLARKASSAASSPETQVTKKKKPAGFDTSQIGHERKRDEKTSVGKSGKTLKTPKYKLSFKDRQTHHTRSAFNRKDPKQNPKHTAHKSVKEDKAFDYVVAKLKKQHGDGVLTKRDKIKPQSPAEKAKVRAHQAKVDKENAAERAKDPSQGRYPKG